MVFTTMGKSGVALIAFTGSGTVPEWLALGSGSGTVAVTQTGLVHEVRRNKYDSRNAGTSTKVSWVTDFDSVTMSGIILREFGFFNNATAGSGDMFNREIIADVTFDGTNELQVDLQFEVF